MNNPQRLAETSGNPIERRLLQVGRSYRSSPAARARIAAAIGLGSTQLFASSSAAAVSTSLLAKVLVAGALVSGVAVYYARDDEPAPAAKVAPVAVPQAQPPSPPEALPGSEPQSAAPVAASSVRTPRSTSSAKPRGEGTSDLGQEVARLDAAQKALGSGRAAQSIALLDGYAREFPKGNLRMEAAVLRIEALAAAGRRGEAREAAKRFLAQHPKSVLAARARRYAD